MERKRVLVGVSGASGAPLAVELLRTLRELDGVETHLICSHWGRETLSCEAGISPEELAVLHGAQGLTVDELDARSLLLLDWAGRLIREDAPERPTPSGTAVRGAAPSEAT